MPGLSPEQLIRLEPLLEEALLRSRFYRSKFTDQVTVSAFRELPFTLKSELVADQEAFPPYGSNLLAPLEDYCRLHQTSGTSSGKPLRWLDTQTSWEWMLHCWRKHFEKLGITRVDRLFFPFSFGPFLGFWTAFEYASRNGFFLLPGGGQSSSARLKMILDHRISVVFATPTYAMHLAEVAQNEKLNLVDSSVRAIVVAGEPGGSIPGTRDALEKAWGARVYDHYGLTEVGPIATESTDNPSSLEVLDEFIAEVVEPNGSAPVSEGEIGELVITNLGRTASPLIRYRTGDLVKFGSNSRGIELVGGVLGRTDEMLHIRGNNIYPSAIEAILRRFPEVAEYRLIVDKSGPMTELELEVELRPDSDSNRLAEAIPRAIREGLLFRVEFRLVPPGSLPRFEMKARRVVQRMNS
jgi:phenylacetate-CoA ligase